MSTDDTHFTLHGVQTTKPKVCAANKPQLLISTSCYCSTPPLMWVCPKMATGADGRGGGEEGARVIDLFYSFFHPVLAFFFSKMSTGVDGGCSERGCSISDIFFIFPPLSSFLFYFSKMATSLHFFYPCPTFFLLFKNGHRCRWWLRGRGMQRWWSSRPQRKQNPRQKSEPTRTHHVCCTSCTYMPRLCLNCVPTRTHHVSCHSLGCSPAFGHSFH